MRAYGELNLLWCVCVCGSPRFVRTVEVRTVFNRALQTTTEAAEFESNISLILAAPDKEEESSASREVETGFLAKTTTLLVVTMMAMAMYGLVRNPDV